jgi:hypothetical protein
MSKHFMYHPVHTDKWSLLTDIPFLDVFICIKTDIVYQCPLNSINAKYHHIGFLSL